MKYFTIVVKEGKDKNKIIDERFAQSRKEFFERNKQSLIDCGLYLEAAGFVFKRNFVIKSREA